MDCKHNLNTPTTLDLSPGLQGSGIVNGCKYKVDYNFGVVDVSSAMKRVESSKEALRNLVVIDPDGSTEWQEVYLDPPNWCVELEQLDYRWYTPRLTSPRQGGRVPQKD